MLVYWVEQSLGDVPAGDDWLSSAEAARLARMRFNKRRADWRLGRWTAKRGVALFLNAPLRAARVEIGAAPSGAPEVSIAGRPGFVSISLSHSAGRAACAIAEPGAKLGCDLEAIEQRSDAFVADYFTAQERHLVAAAPPEERPRIVTLLWSAKESGLKALHEGLRVDTRSVVVTFEPGPGQWRPLEVRHRGAVFPGWWQSTAGLVRTLVAFPAPDQPFTPAALPPSGFS